MRTTFSRPTVALRLVALPMLLAACTRGAETHAPRVTAEKPRDAGVVAPRASASADASAGPAPSAPPESPLSIVARAPMPVRFSTSAHVDQLGSALPLVQRLPNGGLVVASEHGRARAEGTGPLAVELLGAGFESSVLAQHSYVNTSAAIRWVWAGPEATVVVDESDVSRVGPSVETYRLGAKGFERTSATTGYWSAVSRGGALLALERSTRRRKGDGVDWMVTVLQRARIAVLAGKGPAPTLPAGFCPHAMSAALDGSLAVAGEDCSTSQPAVVRFAPDAREGKREALAPRGESSLYGALVVLAVSADDVWVADEGLLQHWDGKAWSSSTPFGNDSALLSLSRAPGGELWAVVHATSAREVSGRLVRREGAAWKEVPLPKAPADTLDDESYSDVVNDFAYTRGGAAMIKLERGAGSTGPLVPWRVDASGDEVLVVASEQDEAFVLSTRARSPVARIPSVTVQRARLARTMKRREVTSPKQCDDPSRTTLVFADGTTVDALQKAIGSDTSVLVAEGVIEGKPRAVAYGFDGEQLAAAKKRLAAFSPRHLCGAPVLDKAPE